MSEYQYYEFLAIDRPLSTDQIAQVRRYSSRAEVSSTRFVNTYEYGDFRGNPEEFLQKFFDVFVYVANWGTHRLMIKVPAELVDAATIKQYSIGELLSVKQVGEHLLIDVHDCAEPGNDWVDGEGWMDPLSMVRREVLDGDFRALYLVWLHGLVPGNRAASREPPVPPGLGSLTHSHRRLIEFFRIDTDLVAAASAASPPMPEKSTPDLRAWIASLAPSEKDDALEKLMAGNDPMVIERLRQRHRNSRGNAADSTTSSPRRTIGDLFSAAESHRVARLRAEEEQRVINKRRREAEAAKEHAAFLAALVGRQEEAWREVNVLIEDGKSANYEKAVKLLAGLKEIAARAGIAESAAFNLRLTPLRKTYSRKHGLMSLMNKAGLR